MMTRQQAADAIRAEFPQVKVLLLDMPSARFVDGIGVELPDGRRNAIAVKSGSAWGGASDKLISWLRRVAKPADASSKRSR
jgi:hypothetical protein